MREYSKNVNLKIVLAQKCQSKNNLFFQFHNETDLNILTSAIVYLLWANGL